MLRCKQYELIICWWIRMVRQIITNANTVMVNRKKKNPVRHSSEGLIFILKEDEEKRDASKFDSKLRTLTVIEIEEINTSKDTSRQDSITTITTGSNYKVLMATNRKVPLWLVETFPDTFCHTQI